MSYDHIFVGLAFLFPLMLYCYTLCPTVPVGDGGELICAAHSLGIAHPPGYPLYCLLGRLFVLLLPLSSVAARVNLMSAFFAALTAPMVYLLVRRLEAGSKNRASFGRSVAALSAALMFASLETVWSQAVQAEVYTLHAFLVGALLLAITSWQLRLDGRMAYLGAFLSGLALAHHTSVLFLLGAGLWLLIWGRRRLALVQRLPAMLLFFLLGISLYLYLPVRSSLQPPHDWGNPETLGRLWDHILARQYRRLFLFTSPADMFTGLRQYLASLGHVWGIFLSVILAGAFVQLQRQKGVFILLLLAVLGNVLVAVSYDIPDIEAYYLPSFLIFSLWLGLALSAGLEWLQSRGLRMGLRRSLVCIPAAVVIIPLILNLPRSSQRTRTIARDYGLSILSSVAPDGILFTTADNETFPALYLHDVEGLRPDVEMFDLGSRREHLRRFAGLEEREGKEDSDQLRRMVIQQTRRPVHFAKEHMSMATDPLRHKDLLLESHGLVYRLRRSPDEGAMAPFPWHQHAVDSFTSTSSLRDFKAAMMVANYRLCQGEDLWARGDSSAAEEAFASARGAIGDVHQAQIHNSMGVFFRRLGWIREALEEFQLALECTQRTRAQESDVYVNLGNISVDQGQLDLAEKQFRRALYIWPKNSAARFNLARLKATQYLRQGDYAAAAEEYQNMLAVEPDNPAICYNLGLLLAHRLDKPQQAMACFRHYLQLVPQGDLSQSARLELERLEGGSGGP